MNLAQDNLVVLHDPVLQRWLIFEHPLRIYQTGSVAEIPGLLKTIQAEVNQGLFAAGFLAYEAAPAFDPAFQVKPASQFPLAWFGIYREPQLAAAFAWPDVQPADTDWESPVSREAYCSAIRRIRQYVQKGDTYQVNYSIRLKKSLAGEPWPLFTQLVRAQGPHYAAFMNTDRWAVCCASPELFFRLQGNELTCRPMKGTTRRGLWAEQDKALSRQLQASEKNRAENVMIVDMVRNDLGRIAHRGSVQVEHLFQIEKFPTLWQMTSTVNCQTGAELPEIFGALFPAASITGAPKVRTMQIIAELEESPRNIYTGAIGYITPQRQAQFNVAIRTVLVDKQAKQAEYGVGGGIVWDSVAEEEFEECQTKARVLKAPPPDFALLETMLWTPAGGFFLLEAHLHRLAESAEYFSIPLPPQDVREQLRLLDRSLSPAPQRIRLLLHSNGKVVFEAQPIPPHLIAKEAGTPVRSRITADELINQCHPPYRVCLAPKPVDRDNRFLYHKTTQRAVYEQALATCPGYDDVLLCNEKEELTESTIANLAVEKDGQLVTPPLECGLLPGVYRALLLERKLIKEEKVRVQDLPRCQKIYLLNSVRGVWEATLSG